MTLVSPVRGENNHALGGNRKFPSEAQKPAPPPIDLFPIIPFSIKLLIASLAPSRNARFEDFNWRVRLLETKDKNQFFTLIDKLGRGSGYLRYLEDLLGLAHPLNSISLIDDVLVVLTVKKSI